MLLKEFLAELAVSEIRDLGWIDSESSEIVSDQLPKVVTAINDAVSTIFTTYILHTNIGMLDTTVKTFFYQFSAPDMVQVLDVAMPLEDLTLSDVGMKVKIHTKDTLWFNHVPHVNTVPILFQATLPRLSATPVTAALLEQVLDIPAQMIAPVRAYVGHLIYGNMTGDAHLNKSNQLLARYSDLVQTLEISGAISRNYVKPENLYRANGFV